MRIFGSLLVIQFLLFVSAKGQDFSYCIEQKSFTDEIGVTIDKMLGKKEYSVDYVIDMCYTGNKDLVVKINPVFKQNDNILNEKRIEKDRHRFYADNISVTGDETFYFKVEPGQLVEKDFTYVLAPKQNVSWKNKTLVITHQFRYEVEGVSESQEFTCTLPIPDGSTITETVAPPETIVVQPVVKKEPRVIQPQPVVEEVPEPPKQKYNCIDSVWFYYRKVLTLYERLNSEQLNAFKIAEAKASYQNSKQLFDYFSQACSDAETAIYINEFKRVTAQLQKLFNGNYPAAGTNGGLANNSGQTGDMASDSQAGGESNGGNSGEVSLSRSSLGNPLKFLLGGLIGLVIVAFFIMKFGKKIVRKRKKRR